MPLLLVLSPSCHSASNIECAINPALSLAKQLPIGAYLRIVIEETANNFLSVLLNVLGAGGSESLYFFLNRKPDFFAIIVNF